MYEVGAVARQVVEVIAPFLPYLLAGGEYIAQGTAREVGKDAWNAAKSLWDRLRGRVEANPSALESAKDVASLRSDDAVAALRLQISKILQSDPQLLEDLGALCQSTSVRSSTISITGDRNISVGGDATQSRFSTGDEIDPPTTSRR